MGPRSGRSPSRLKRAVTPVMSRAEAVFLMVVAAVVAVVATALAVSEIRALLTGPVTLDLPLGNIAVPRVDGVVEEVRGARYSSVEVAFESVPPTEGLLLAVSAGLNALIVVAVCVLVWVLCRRIAAERTFTRGAEGAIGVVGILVAVAGTLAQALGSAGRDRLVGYSGLFPGADGRTVFFLEFSPTPVVIGLVMALFAAIVHRGRRLQDDVVGLV
ncbi:DUF2975 domain-containing protein [Arthrobacter sp. MSA 4-2]|uniref:DUF2975 domain-containing protein n=1 Tax=Arthrobacter sp. MSA 4-2 TaxID=2794349 RepID=UPI0018E8BB6A|nr:DUF2975 domain-containing protein [Arthrobacter sp. MSA 4-2]MBJ2120336.1 DUF2975 domain-containing protein [Arthrobacter sp. MSA 4-2]